MAILCPDLNLLFIMVPGTGCSVLGNLLTSEFGGQRLPERDIIRDGKVVHGAKHNSVDKLLRDGVLSREELAQLTVVANIRNPYDRLVTYYQRLAGDWVDYSLGVREREMERNRQEAGDYASRRAALTSISERLRRRQEIMRRIGFNPWIVATLGRKAVSRSGLSEFAFPMLKGVHFAVRNELLGEGVNQLFTRLGVARTVEIPRKNVTQGKRPYTSYWNGVSRFAFDRLLNRDLERFGYKFDTFDRDTPLLDLRKQSSPVPAVSEAGRASRGN